MSVATTNKSEIVREAIKALGPDAKVGELKQWVAKHYEGVEIVDNTYYVIKKSIRPEPRARVKADPADLPSTPLVGAIKVDEIPGVINQIKQLVEAVGSKETLKNLIDAI